ncbi:MULTISPECIES: hypothetical protein [Chryseobacterium]|uniref:hypothetical protein n=1 Tax=Chryseobacterium TaxID=59732 RepID=UPI000FA3DABA|nr:MULTISPECIES: hypothetical protein [Chryseobacterium]MBM7418060.1 hypothetical protein [Chryseobacterium sp. JUb44]MDH6212263.1 hypothetical protein [Chryseobacterium sp. BIGb0186]WSO10876.1 hypothetical protein VUJ64_02895 [Chryseobacterium scophthalmum]
MRILLFSSIFFLFSCSGNDELTENQPKEELQPGSAMKGVYIAGSENKQACYWKDNEKVILNDGNNMLATKIFVSDHHSYVIGSSSGDGATYIWQDNIKKKLSDYYNLPASNKVYFQGAHLYNNDFYLLGMIHNPDEPTANKYEVCYWKNGIKTSLIKLDSPQKIMTRNITVRNNDVYVAVSMTQQYTWNILDNGYFKNGQYTSLNKPGYYLSGVYGDVNNLKLMYRNDVACTINTIDLLNNSSFIQGISNPFKMFFNNGNSYVQGLSDVWKNNTKIHASYDGGYYYNIMDFELNKAGTDSYIIKGYATANPSYTAIFKNNVELKRMTYTIDIGDMFDIFVKD